MLYVLMAMPPITANSVPVNLKILDSSLGAGGILPIQMSNPQSGQVTFVQLFADPGPCGTPGNQIVALGSNYTPPLNATFYVNPNQEGALCRNSTGVNGALLRVTTTLSINDSTPQQYTCTTNTITSVDGAPWTITLTN